MNKQQPTKASLVGLFPILLSFFVMGFVDIVGISVSYVKNDFLLNNTISNLLPMMVFVWFGVCSIPVGLLMSKIGRKNTVLLSAVITGLGLILPLISYTLPMVMTAFAVLGIGNTILQVSLNPLVANVVSPQKFTSTLTFGQFIKAICSASGPVMVSGIAAMFGDWKLIFAVYAVIIALSFVWLLLIPIPKEESTKAQGIGVVVSLLKERYILALWTIIVLIVGFEVGLMTTVPKFFTEIGLTLDQGGLANTIYFIARTLGTFIGSMLLARVVLRSFLIRTLIVAIACLILFIAMDTPMALYLFIFMVGVCCANVFAIAFSQAIQFKPEYANEISSLMIVGVAGGALIPPVMGVLADATSQRVSLVITVASLLYILFVALFVMKGETKRTVQG